MRILVPLLATAGLCAADFTVKPLMVQLGAPAGVELSFQDKPMGYETGYVIHLLVHGEGIAGIKDDSLAITTLAAADGKNLATGRTGKPAWKMGSFPKVTEDGKVAIFSIEGPDNLLGRVDGVTLTGSITLLLGSEVGTAATGEIDAKASKPVQFPGFTVKTGHAASVIHMLGGGGDDQGISVTVEGNLGAIIEVKASQGGAALESSSSSSNDTWRTYDFSGKPAGTVAVTVTYWKDLKEQVLPLQVALKP
jgi:hypothetical protein